LLGLLAKEGKYLVLGDFNLYHLLWSGLRNPAVYLAIEPVVEVLLVGNIELAISRGMIMWEVQGLISTIDLAFISQLL